MLVIPAQAGIQADLAAVRDRTLDSGPLSFLRSAA
jgi:hypothetical protein